MLLLLAAAAVLLAPEDVNALGYSQLSRNILSPLEFSP